MGRTPTSLGFQKSWGKVEFQRMIAARVQSGVRASTVWGWGTHSMGKVSVGSGGGVPESVVS
jgi:hypothetical protein